MNRIVIPLLIVTLMFMLSGCVSMKLFPDYSEPLHEFTLSGKDTEKVLMIPIRGVITSDPDEGFITTSPSMVQEVVAQLDLAEKDPKIKSVLLQIDSPGGSVTASDILYKEIESFKKKTGKKIVTLFMNVAASGGYYIALPSDRIIAHPTSVTGSIGVIFIRPNIEGLMFKIGVEAEVTKSGEYKDMGSPFRETTDDERKLFQDMVDEMYTRFVTLVAQNRNIDLKRAREIADGRIYTAGQAEKNKLIDSTGYLKDAIAEAKRLAGISEKSRVVVYRRSPYANDNAYNTISSKGSGETPKLIDLGISRYLTVPRTGFYYLWAPEYD